MAPGIPGTPSVAGYTHHVLNVLIVSDCWWSDGASDGPMEREPSGVVLLTGDLQMQREALALGCASTDMDGMWACACSIIAGMHCGVGSMMGVPASHKNKTFVTT
jgi:hypothetical protein